MEPVLDWIVGEHVAGNRAPNPVHEPVRKRFQPLIAVKANVAFRLAPVFTYPVVVGERRRRRRQFAALACAFDVWIHDILMHCVIGLVRFEAPVPFIGMASQPCRFWQIRTQHRSQP